MIVKKKQLMRKNNNVDKNRRRDPLRGREWSTPETKDETKVRVVSYNVLCESAVKKYKFELYPKQTRDELNPEKRLAKIFEDELKRLKPDIINAQEIEEKRFEWIKSMLKTYEGYFVKKGRGKTDGVATFYKTSKFSLSKMMPQIRVALRGTDDDAFGLVLVLENKKKRTIVVNGNAHILFAPKNGLVKLAQVKEILEVMESARRKTENAASSKQRPSSRVMKIFSLDGNFLPNSALYKFVEEGYFDKMSCNRRNMGGYLNDNNDEECYGGDEDSEEVLGLSFNETNLQSWNDNCHDLSNAHKNVFKGSHMSKLNRESGRMRSAYKEALKEEPQWTSCHSKFSGTTDYIFFDESAVKVKRVLKTPSARNWTNNPHEKRLPNMKYPSDHLSIAADFIVLDDAV